MSIRHLLKALLILSVLQISSAQFAVRLNVSFARNRETLVPTPSVPSPKSAPDKRAAIPSCLKTIELSCQNLAADCLNPANADTMDNLWGVKSCVAAATCYGVGDILTSIECQTGFAVTNSAQASLDYNNVYAPIVGDCAYQTGGCPITQQNYVDSTMALSPPLIPLTGQGNSADIVVAFWETVYTWTATGPDIPYLNFNDYLHFSTFPSSGSTTTLTQSMIVSSISQVTWNPNPFPPTTATSETFVRSSSTVIVPVPSATTTISIAGTPITLAPGGTPVVSALPKDISIVGAITPTGTPNIQPPTSAVSVTFTAPPSFTTVVKAPVSSDTPAVNITGPAGDMNSDNDNWWLLVFGLFGPVVSPPGALPADVGIPGGITPVPVPPPDWTDTWSNPQPSSTTSRMSVSASSSQSSSAPTCSVTAAFSLSDDAENVDWEDNGNDPDRRRGWKDRNNRTSVFARADPRHIGYYTVGAKSVNGAPKTDTKLDSIPVNGKPVPGNDGTPQEHVFELGYINQFFTDFDFECDWIENNVFNYVRADGSNMGLALVGAIDQTFNMVWVDKLMNQAKSNVVNRNKLDATMPPQQKNMDKITSLDTRDPSFDEATDLEFFLRNFAALGDYFGATSQIFVATATRVQNLLSEITPDVPVNPSLPSQFNQWLKATISTYPDGCTSRAFNVYDYYSKIISDLQRNTKKPVPACLALYNAGRFAYKPSSFTWQNLMPAPPASPVCNGPGTAGAWVLYKNPDGSPVFDSLDGTVNGIFRTMGSGSTSYFSFGSGNDIGGEHFYAIRGGGACAGVYRMVIKGTPADANAKSYVGAVIALNCGGATGKVNTPFTFVVENQQLSCLIYDHGDNTTPFDLFCGPAQDKLNTCIQSVLAASMATYPQGFVKTADFEFWPF
ncbi:hypothetical protein C8R43DRAFT_1118818 [Mycena crocata]|nr:hypothetical protein C8R43DRAFT_1118818 [Mycena crocata]